MHPFTLSLCVDLFVFVFLFLFVVRFQDFKADSAEAANTITPIGGYVLKNAFEQNKTPVDAC